MEDFFADDGRGVHPICALVEGGRLDSGQVDLPIGVGEPRAKERGNDDEEKEETKRIARIAHHDELDESNDRPNSP